MAYNTQKIITDIDGNPISQYYNPDTDKYESVLGGAGANRVILYNKDGSANNSLSLVEMLNLLSQLTGTVIDEETRKTNEMSRSNNEEHRQGNEDIRNRNEIERVESEDIRISNEEIRESNENIRKENESDRVNLYEDLIQKLNNGYFDGKNLEFHWWGTELGVKAEGDLDYVYVNLKGDTGSIDNLTKQHIINALNYSPLKSVNDKIADENGNVDIELPPSVEVIDNLTTDDSTKALSANMGKELFQYVSDGKGLVATAITDKGVVTEGSDTFQQMADNIGEIEIGIDTSDATALASDILNSKIAYVKKQRIVGTMVERTSHITGQSITRSGNTLRIRPQPGFYGGATTNSVQYSDSNWIGGNILKGVSIFGLNGTLDVLSLAPPLKAGNFVLPNTNRTPFLADISSVTSGKIVVTMNGGGSDYDMTVNIQNGKVISSGGSSTLMIGLETMFDGKVIKLYSKFSAAEGTIEVTL